MKIKYLKKTIIGGVVGGLFFAVFMAGFDYVGNEPFNFPKFMFHFIGFGLFQALFFNYNFRKNEKDLNSKS